MYSTAHPRIEVRADGTIHMTDIPDTWQAPLGNGSGNVEKFVGNWKLWKHQALSEAKRVLKSHGEIYITLISKNTYSFSAPETTVVDSNVRLKMEEDGNLSPHYYVDRTEIPALVTGMKILELKQVEDIYGDKSSWHYFVHAVKE